MADNEALRQFFLAPPCPQQRQYEALRAVFVEGLSQKDAAERFGYSYGAFRQLVLHFRTQQDAGGPPPFSPHAPAAPRPRRPRPAAPVRLPSPTPGC